MTYGSPNDHMQVDQSRVREIDMFYQVAVDFLSGLLSCVEKLVEPQELGGWTWEISHDYPVKRDFYIGRSLHLGGEEMAEGTARNK